MTDLDADLIRFRKFLAEHGDFLAKLKARFQEHEAHPEHGEPPAADAAPQGFFGGGSTLPAVHDLEGLNGQLQGAASVFDLSKIDVASFKAGFADLVKRLTTLEAEHKRLAEATADLGEAVTAVLSKPKAETVVDAQGEPAAKPE